MFDFFSYDAILALESVILCRSKIKLENKQYRH